MKLIYTPTSPFARKVRVVALECGHTGIEEAFDHPLAEGSTVAETNPLGKVPALVLDDGTTLVDSRVICEFLDHHQRTPTLLPASGLPRFQALTGLALGDGILDAAVASVMELRRPPAKRSPFWLTRWQDAIVRTVGEIDRRLAGQGDVFDMAAVSWACAFGYLEFRLPHIDFRNGHGRVDAWWQAVAERPSLAATQHHGMQQPQG